MIFIIYILFYILFIFYTKNLEILINIITLLGVWENKKLLIIEEVYSS